MSTKTGKSRIMGAIIVIVVTQLGPDYINGSVSTHFVFSLSVLLRRAQVITLERKFAKKREGPLSRQNDKIT